MRLKYKERALQTKNPAAHALFELMAKKQTNLCFSNDVTNKEKFLELTDEIGPEICFLKTHIDIIEDFDYGFIKEVIKLSRKHDFLIFEDRKFADIGNTVKLQYSKGIYKISDWANFVNVHVLPGSGIIDAINEVIKEKKDNIPRGILILAQMSSSGNLLNEEYTKKAIEIAKSNKEVVAGFIGTGKLKEISGNEFIVLTPGVKIFGKSDSLGQTYNTPESAIESGSDCIIVGRGIYKSKNPRESAQEYKKRGWETYEKIIKGIV